MLQLIKVAFLNLMRRKSRTVLALLGICIGIAALTTLIALVDGLNADATDLIGKMQGFMVWDKSVPDQSMSFISDSYESRIKSIPGVKRVVPEIYHTVGKINNETVPYGMDAPVVTGINPEDLDYCAYASFIDKVTKGRELKSTDKKSIMITEDFSDKYKKGVGESIDIDGTKFKIIGIMKLETSMAGNPIIMTLDDSRDLYNIDNDKISSYYVHPINPDNSKNLSKLMEFKFDKLQAMGQQEMMEQMGELLDNLKLFAIIVSIVSAIVAGIGVINTMLMSVMERTKEIGTLKAVGWTKENIMLVILMESVFIGVIGSILGIILGYFVATTIGAQFDFTTLVSLNLIIQNFLFGILLGIIGGIYPAWIAAKMDPVDALRSN